MNRYLWRLELAWTMIIHGWGLNRAKGAFKGEYDDPFYDERPDDPLRGLDVLIEETRSQ